MINSNESVKQLDKNSLLYNLSQIRGINAVLSRIPDDMSGIYAWYRCYALPSDARTNPEVFLSSILQEMYKPHFATREARIPPSTKLTVQAETSFYKQEELRSKSFSPMFRELLCDLLENSLVFQQPLYIGQSNNIKRRIKSHLAEGSALRTRLKYAGHDLDKCKLLVIQSQETNSIDREGAYKKVCAFEDECENDFSFQIELEDEDYGEFTDREDETLLEDLLSRLFLPSFTLRYG
jgi:predicted GIY-YIG superfamily endonuclease